MTEHRLLETLAFVPGEGLRNLDRHLARMADSADWAGFRFDRAAVLDAVHASRRADVAEPARVRILLARDGHVEVELQACRRPPPGRCASRSTTTRSTPPTRGSSTRPPAATST